MRRFTELFREVDASRRTGDKLAALRRYFAEAPAEDAVWALWFLWGNRLRLGIPARRLRQWAADVSGHPDWLVEACHERVGDLAETAALLLPLNDGHGCELPLHAVIERHLLPLRDWDDRFQLQLLRDLWLSLDRDQALVLNKMLTGAFRIGVSRQLVMRGLAEALGLELAVLSHRLMGDWPPTAAFFRSLTDATDSPAAAATRPYPFYLATPLPGSPDALGSPADWCAEWKWDGVRAQLIRRGGDCHLWSRGDERLTGAFPEIVAAAAGLPDGTVLDGEILCWREDRPLGFHALQTRITRKRLEPALLQQAPAVFMAYDCLEWQGADIRSRPLAARQAHMQEALRRADPAVLRCSPLVPFADWAALARAWSTSRARGVEGLMLKRRDGPYRDGRVRGEWWKWKVAPFTADLVLVYAQAGHGRRATLYTDYTLAARAGDRFVPVAKAYSGLTDAELRELDRWIKARTLARHGPVRTVPPEMVFEVGFEGLRPSTRHKSGLALRFPRILRWRRDKRAEEADTLEQLRGLLG